jgi:hypothetical protein
MRTAGFLSAMCIVVLGQRAHADPPPAPGLAQVVERNQTITANPLAMLGGSLSAEYERATASGLSLFVGPSFAYASASSGAASVSMFGLGATAGARIFFANAAPKGLWVGPQGTLIYLSGDFGGSGSVSAIGYSLAGLIGYTWVWDNGFVLSLGGGIQYVALQLQDSTTTSGPAETVGVKGVLPALRLSLGYAF